MVLTLRPTDLERSPAMAEKNKRSPCLAIGVGTSYHGHTRTALRRASLSKDGEFTVLKKLSICAALSFLLVSSAMAQSRVCAADIKQACANIEPGGGRIAACVKEKFNNFSDACKARLAEVAAAAKTCREEVNKECGSAQRLKKVVCVKDALSKLSDGCKASISAVVSGGKN
jgi:hypothetical protein